MVNTPSWPTFVTLKVANKNAADSLGQTAAAYNEKHRTESQTDVNKRRGLRHCVRCELELKSIRRDGKKEIVGHTEDAMMRNQSAPGRTVSLVLTVWLLLAFVVGGIGWLRSAPAPLVAVTVTVLTMSALVACGKIDAISQWLGAVDLRRLVSLHLTRFIGIYFLVLAHRGELNPAFARPAGIGDCVIAAGALLLLIFWRHLNGNVLLLIWNTFGLVDILLVVVLALRIGLQNWISMSPLRELPLSLLPTFLVPLIIVSHIFIFTKVARANTAR